jgi:hypothetical protein
MTALLTIKGFLAHCESMGDTEVNHSNWSTCAIGTYLESVGVPVKHGYDYLCELVPEEYSDIVDQFLDAFPKKMLDALDDRDENLNTYNDIAESRLWSMER